MPKIKRRVVAPEPEPQEAARPKIKKRLKAPTTQPASKASWLAGLAKKPEVKSPAFSIAHTSTKSQSYTTRLAEPLKIKNAEVGLKVAQSGELCRIARIDPCPRLKGMVKDGKRRFIVEFRNHPTRDSFTTVMFADDVVYRRIEKVEVT